MSFFPSGFDANDDAVGVLELVKIDTPDGPARFIVGTDGLFVDVDGNEWVGSTLISSEGTEIALGGAAPTGSLTLSFFQDPTAGSLIEEVNDLGDDYVEGQAITFYVQPIADMGEFYAPSTPPLQFMQRTARKLSFNLAGAQDRSIQLEYESAFEGRSAAPGIVYNTKGHEKLIGSANPSLEFMPTNDFQEEPLWG